MIGDERNCALAAEIDIGLVDHHRDVGMLLAQPGDLRARRGASGRRVGIGEAVAWLNTEQRQQRPDVGENVVGRRHTWVQVEATPVDPAHVRPSGLPPTMSVNCD